MPFDAPFEATRWKVRSGVADVGVAMFSARPVVVSIVLPLPVTLIVPLVVGLEALAATVRVDVEAAAGEVQRVAVAPAHHERVLAGLPAPAEVVVLIVLTALLKVVEPPVLRDSAMPPPASFVSLIGPLKVTAPPVRPVISAVCPRAVVERAGEGDAAAAAVEVEARCPRRRRCAAGLSPRTCPCRGRSG